MLMIDSLWWAHSKGSLLAIATTSPKCGVIP